MPYCGYGREDEGMKLGDRLTTSRKAGPSLGMIAPSLISTYKVTDLGSGTQAHMLVMRE